MTNEWIPLHEPRWELETQGRLAFTIPDDRSDTKLMVVCSEDEDYYKSLNTYDVKTQSWDHFELQCSYELGLDKAASAANGVVYWYSKKQNNLLGYDLASRNWFPDPVAGLEEANVFPHRTDESPVWILHLGGEKMCLTRYVKTHESATNMTVYCTIFRVDKCDNGKGETILVATIESSACSHVNGSECLDVIAL